MGDLTCQDKICASYSVAADGTVCQNVQIKGAATNTDVEVVCLEDDNGGFVRVLIIDPATGAVSGQTDWDFSGAAYTVSGAIKKPGSPFDIEAELFCDDNGVQFLKHTVYNSDGTISSVFDTDLSGAAFVPALPIKPLGGQQKEVTTELLCDEGNSDMPYVLAQYHDLLSGAVTSATFEVDGTTAYTPVTPGSVKPEAPFQAIEICVVNQDDFTIDGSFAFAGSTVTVTDASTPHPLDPINGRFIDWGDGTTSPVYSPTHDYEGCPPGEYSIVVNLQTEGGSCFRYRRLVQWDGLTVVSIQPNTAVNRTVSYDIWARKVHKHVECDGTVKGIYNRVGIADTLGANEIYRFKCPEPYIEKPLGASTRPIKLDAKPFSSEKLCVAVNGDTTLAGAYSFAGSVLTLVDSSTPHPSLTGPNLRIIDWGVGRCSNIGHGFNSFDYEGYPPGDYLAMFFWTFFETGEVFRYSRTVSFNGTVITAISNPSVSRTISHNVKVRDVIRHYDCEGAVKGTVLFDGTDDILGAGQAYLMPDDCKPVVEPFKNSPAVQKIIEQDKKFAEVLSHQRIGTGATNLGLTVPAGANGAIIQFQLRDPTGDAGACARYYANGETPSAGAGYLAQHKEYLYLGCAASNGATITDPEKELGLFLFNQGEATNGYFIEVTYYAY